MRITSLASALLAIVSFGFTGCERSEIEPVAEPETTEPAELDVVVVEPEVPDASPAAQPGSAAQPDSAAAPENTASAPGGLEMPADAAPEPGAAPGAEPAANEQAAAQPEPLTIGSQAPPLNIEHWIQLGNGKYEPVTEFQEGNVYIVEFWATWCGPCIASMPHLAETQQEYADQGVRLISVSDEPVDTVQQFLDTEVRSSGRAAEGEEKEGEEKQTYRELTSVYSLTTDPDRSTHAAYMEAANQNGIPTAFIVGKTGEVEWIGHPMTMDEPLQAIVKGDWDRAEFAKQMELKSQIAKAQNLMRQGQMDEGLALVNQLLDQIKDPELLLGLKFFKLQALIAMQDKSEEVPALAADLINSAGERPEVMPQLSWVIYQATRTSEVPKDLLEKTIKAADAAIQDMDPDQRPSMLDTLAHLHAANGDLDAAIAAQQQAVDLSEGRTKERLQQYLEELKAEKEGGDAKPEAAAEEKPEAAAEEKPEAAAEAKPEAAAEESASEAPEVVEEVNPESSEEAAEAGDGAEPQE